MRALWKMTVVEAKLFFREPLALFFTIVFPVMILLLFAGIFGNEPVPGMPGVRSVDVQAPGYTTMVIGTVALIGLPVTLASYRQQGILRRMRATPLRAWTILAAQVLVNLTMTAAGIALLLLVARIAFGMRPPDAPLGVAFAFVLSSLSFFAVGFVLAGLFSSVRTAQAVGQVIYFPMLFLSGAILPREMFPDFLKSVSDFVPLTYVVDLVQKLWLGGEWDMTALAVLAGMLVLGIALSTRTFRWE